MTPSFAVLLATSFIGTVLGAQVGYPFTGAACAFVVTFGLIVIWGGL